MEIKHVASTYIVSDGEVVVQLTINRGTKTFDIISKTGSNKFLFQNSHDVVMCAKVGLLISKAAEYAGKIFAEQPYVESTEV